MLFPSLKDPYAKKGYVIVTPYLHIVTWICVHYIEFSVFSHELSMQQLFFFPYRNTSMMLPAAQDTFLGVWKQSKGGFVEDLYYHQAVLLPFFQEVQISKGQLMSKGSSMGMPAKRPYPCSTILQTISRFSRRWERPFSTGRSLLMIQAGVMISSQHSQDSWIQKDW